MRVTFIGHATVLLQMDGLNILTDPIWSERASPVRFAGPRRVHPPGLRFEDLPHIDLVLVSHNHYDHLDLPTLRRLERAHRPRFLLPLGNAAILERAGIAGGEDLDWWQGLEVAEGVRVTLVPSRHFSSRSLCDAWRTLWGSFVVQGPSGAAFFAGDTGFGGHFEEIARRFAPFRLAILPIGAYEPRWFMAPMHMSPADSVRAATILRAAVAVGIHHATFRLSDEGQTQASRDLDEAMGGTDPRMRFWHLDFGEARDVPESDAAFEVRFETP
jgi:L-ascorbate metabolism protein UlaG (beta-lactamase superfamily)